MAADYKEFKAKFNSYLDDENYLAAYSNLKDSGLGKADRNELAGLMVNDIITKLESLPAKIKNERRAVLQSMLLWIFRDYPGLGQLYKTQIRGRSDRDVLSFIKDMRDPETAQERMTEEVDNFFDGVKQNLHESAEDIKTGRAEDKVKDFIDKAESNVREGIRNIADIFESITKNTKKDE